MGNMSESNPNLYASTAFIDREKEKKAAKKGLGSFHKDRKKPRTMIFTGVRFVGKTWFSLHLARTIFPEMNIPTFFISLLPVPEGGEPEAGEWWFDEEPKGTEDKLAEIGNLLDKMARHWGTTEAKEGKLDDKRMYLQQNISELPDSKSLVLIIDSAHESEEEYFTLLQRYVISPLTYTSRVYTIITGRGTPPTWDSPYLRTADSQEIEPFEAEDVGKQLGTPQLKHRSEECDLIAEISGGYPGTVRLLAESDKDDLYDAIPDVLKNLLEDVSPPQWNNVREYLDLISLFTKPFRETEAETLLNQIREEKSIDIDVRAAHSVLIDIHLMEWRSGGYELNKSIRAPVKIYLQKRNPALWSVYYKAAIQLFENLSERFAGENAAMHYENLAKELIAEEG